MYKYNGLLSEVARNYSIKKGIQETEIEWKTRLVYSICGMMAYASLWDESEDELISKLHLKNKVRRMLASYKSMYPELSNCFPSVSQKLEDEMTDSDELEEKSQKLEDEITEQFRRTGVVYYCPHRLVPSMKHEEPFGGVLFQRGIALDRISCVSGIGFYSKHEKVTNSAKIRAMFGLAHESLQSLWFSTLSAASWKSDLLFEQNIEYLRLKPPFLKGYWVNKPDTKDTVSILRTGMKGSRLYYLYRYSGTTIEVSSLPQWQVDAHNYRSITCACLSSYGTFPPIEYLVDGALVHVYLNYLLPPRELEFLKLYSWPETCSSLPCDFRRKLSIEVFTAIKDILSEEGFKFKER